MKPENQNRGVLYIAFGNQWVEETKRSIRSLRTVSDIPVAVITDAPWQGPDEPDHFVEHQAIPGFASKPELMALTPFENTLFIDTDTYVASDVTPAFGLLSHYDMGVHFFGPMLKIQPDLMCHPQCNSGVILYKKNEVVLDVFRRWAEEYEEGVKTRVAKDPRGIGNQRYLAIAIARSTARVVHLDTYLNFTLWDVLVTWSPPMILHGRLAHMETIADEINGKWNVSKDWHPRLWMPNIRGLLPMGVRRSDPLLAVTLILRRAWNDLRRAIVTTRAGRKPGKDGL